jgi:hypothetical protein
MEMMANQRQGDRITRPTEPRLPERPPQNRPSLDTLLLPREQHQRPRSGPGLAYWLHMLATIADQRSGSRGATDPAARRPCQAKPTPLSGISAERMDPLGWFCLRC